MLDLDIQDKRDKTIRVLQQAAIPRESSTTLKVIFLLSADFFSSSVSQNWQWLGPMTPSLMQLVHFKYKGTNETDVGGTKIEDFKDIHYTNKYDKDLEVSTFYRIIIIPWPSYTRAAWEVGKTSKNDAERMHNAKQARGEIIEGENCQL